MTSLYDLDGDGYADLAVHDHHHHLGGGYLGDEYLPDELYGMGGVADPYSLHGGGYGGYGGYGVYDTPLWGYEDGYYPDLYEYMDFLPDYSWGGGGGMYGGLGGGYGDGGLYEMSLYDAWRDESWAEEQYALADLMWFQHQLDLNHSLSEAERLQRWEQRLAWEALDDSARAMRYRELMASDPYMLSNLGLSGGWWGRRFGGVDVDLGYLRDVPMRRGLFAPGYRERFMGHPTLGRRYSPLFSRQRLRGFSSLAPGAVGPAIAARPAAPYASQRLSAVAGTGMSLRERELLGRLRVAEMRASLTGLPAPARARALEDARLIRAELNSETRLARTLDRAERRSDALLAAREAEAERAEMRDEVREVEALGEVERAVGGLVGRPLSVGGLGRGYGGMGGVGMAEMGGAYGTGYGYGY
ncbi:hypothetical protein JCM6882_006902 [Rhodosporidiobolus microsporus]